MENYLAIIGGLFLFLTVGAWLVESGSSVIKKGRSITVKDTMQMLGLAGSILWFCIIFAAISWAVSWAYWFLIGLFTGGF